MKWIVTAIALHLLVVALFWQRSAVTPPRLAWVSPLGEANLFPVTAKGRAVSRVGGGAAESDSDLPQTGEPTVGDEKVVRLGSLREALADGNREPHYPLEAVRKGWQGSSKLRLEYIDGSLFDVALEQSSGYDLLDQEAVQSAQAWRFSWVLPKGKTLVYVPVEFQLVD